MLKRFYANNFRCLENFQLDLGGPSSLLIGPNGAGKSTVTHALAILQQAARGTNRVAQLVKPTDFPRGKSEGPMRIEPARADHVARPLRAAASRHPRDARIIPKSRDFH